MLGRGLDQELRLSAVAFARRSDGISGDAHRERVCCRIFLLLSDFPLLSVEGVGGMGYGPDYETLYYLD